jgi:hypothetical protein
MKDFTENELAILNLIDAPRTKELLIIYLQVHYEEYSNVEELTDYDYKKELLLLHRKGELINLFIAEAFTNRQVRGEC